MFSLVLGCGLDPQFGKDTGIDDGPPNLTGDEDLSDGDTDLDADADGGLPGPDGGADGGIGPDADADADADGGADADADGGADADGSPPGSPSTICPDGVSYYDCDLNYVSSGELSFIGDGWCDEGSAGVNFNCEEFSYDAGDCSGGTGSDADGTGGGCEPLEVEDCDGTCQLSAIVSLYLGDGDCNEGGIFEPNLNCADWSYDSGDCTGGSSDGGTPSGSCPDGESEDCAGVCVADSTIASWRGDGFCDDGSYGADLDCAEFSFDDGDCGSSGGTGDSGTPIECTGDYLGSVTGDSVATGSTTLGASMYSPSCGLTGHDSPDAAYFWFPPSTGPYTFSTVGSDFDTVIAVYESDCSTELACNDDDWTSGTSTSSVELHVSSGSSYVIVVDGYYFYSEGSYVLNINPVGL